MNAPGILLDTGPLVALLSRKDSRHADALRIFGACAPPFRTCEAILAEACFLMRKVDSAGPAEIASLGRRGLFSIALRADEHWPQLEALLGKYSDRSVSFADVCLIRCAEIHEEPRLLTFDDDFTVYRWNKRQRFQAL